MELLKRQTEVILSRGKEKFEGMTTAKNYRNWVLGRISKYGKGRSPKDLEYRMFFEGILNAYNHFHPEVKLTVPVESWKGKSSFQILDGIDKIIIVKYQKQEKGEQPKRVETTATKEEVSVLISIIKKLNRESIKTRTIALSFSNYFKLGHLTWKEFFADRIWHNKLTLILGALDRLGIIIYRGGKTTLLNNNLSLQESLDNFCN